MKTAVIIPLFVLAACGQADQAVEQHQTTSVVAIEHNSNEQRMSFYDFKVSTLEGENFDLADLRGKRVLVVNTASECGFTPQYEQLQELYATYGGENFTVIGFPANNFGGQEPGTHEEIREFCSKNYGVTFPMTEKISVVGENQHPLYQWLTRESMNGVSDAEVKWNFHKFLIDENGNWVASHPSAVSPVDEAIVSFAQGQ